MTTGVAEAPWLTVCPLSAIVADTGVCALVGGTQVAVFRLGTGELYAVGNHDPYSGANVISRGIVGDRAGVPCVASPLYKQAFDLRTGVSLEGDGRELGRWAVRGEGGSVQVRDLAVQVRDLTGPMSSAPPRIVGPSHAGAFS